MSSPSPSPQAADTIPTQAVGIALAVGSGVLIGSSFVFKKKGLLQSQQGKEPGEGVGYLKSPLWWTGMIIMIIGEICNFGAYAFVEAILVTPLGALSVVICAILSHFVLKERLSLFGWIGCAQCIIGSVIIALNGPEEQTITDIESFKRVFLAPGFLSYGAVIIAASLVIIFYVGPKYGKTNMLWYILVCSLIGGLSVSCTQALGACIVTSIRGNNQFKNWFIYFLLAFVLVTLLTEIYYLNIALALFNTAMVTPTYYVLFTFSTLVTSVILYQGLKATPTQIITIVLAFLVICTGISILQLSKVDPKKLNGLDRKTTILLQAAKQEVEMDSQEDGTDPDPEKAAMQRTEDPGIDTFSPGGTIFGTIVRARKRTLRSGTALSEMGFNHPNGSAETRRPTIQQLLSVGSSPAVIGRTSSVSRSDVPLRSQTASSLPLAPTEAHHTTGASNPSSPPIFLSDSPTQLSPQDDPGGFSLAPRRPSFNASVASVPEEVEPEEGTVKHRPDNGNAPHS
ncbi:magnesium transporter NIPA-domain-containing protein [Pterulicium gracile]|uniref:Magnesium transporter NIPA-domain-containing protein n=1 Tax=Pterulicium gracile TaxID=1884261 RepID=A0A5C3QG61_9AGAR|nr:magnesium transporter NIPA-domain-containing protein [Pterula gracilis]